MARYIVYRRFPNAELLGIIEAPTQPAAKAIAQIRWGVDPSQVGCYPWRNTGKRLREKALKKEEGQ